MPFRLQQNCPNRCSSRWPPFHPSEPKSECGCSEADLEVVVRDGGEEKTFYVLKDIMAGPLWFRVRVNHSADFRRWGAQKITIENETTIAEATWLLKALYNRYFVEEGVAAGRDRMEAHIRNWWLANKFGAERLAMEALRLYNQERALLSPEDQQELEVMRWGEMPDRYRPDGSFPTDLEDGEKKGHGS